MGFLVCLLGLSHSIVVNSGSRRSKDLIQFNMRKCVSYDVVLALDVTEVSCGLRNVRLVANLLWGPPIRATSNSIS